MWKNKLLRGAISAAFLITLWAVLSAAIGKPLLLPSPLETLRAFFRLLLAGTLHRAALFSLYRIALGFLIGLLIGILFAALASLTPWLHALLSPVVSVVAATPVASFIVLALVWMRISSVPTFATVLVVLPLGYGNIYTGIQATDPLLLEMARAFSMKKRDMLLRLRIPSVMPYLRAAIASGMGMAWKAGVAAEIIATPRDALGSLLYDAKIYLDTESLFAVTATVVLLSIFVQRLVTHIIREKEGKA